MLNSSRFLTGIKIPAAPTVGALGERRGINPKRLILADCLFHLIIFTDIMPAAARVAKLVDAADLKSAGHCDHAGSIPAPGTITLGIFG